MSWAALNGNTEIVKALIKAGAEVDNITNVSSSSQIFVEFFIGLSLSIPTGRRYTSYSCRNCRKHRDLHVIIKRGSENKYSKSSWSIICIQITIY